MNRVICLHAPKDVGAARDLGRHLAAARRASLLQLWTLDDVAPGEPTGDHVHTQLRLADVFILLLSSEYFADEACARWLALAMQERERRGALLLPVMLRATTLHGSALQGLATLPHNRVPVCQWRARAAAWAEIADVAMGAIEARPIAPAPAQRQWLVPERLVRNRYFTGRHALIEQLNTHMEAPGGSCLLVLHGLGGAGKTQVALELAHQRAAGTATVLWLDATSRDCLLESLREIADRGSPRGAWVPAQVPDVLRWLRRFLEEQRRCLLILDGLEDLALWQEIAPVLGRAGVLVTTRHSDYERLSGAAISAPVPPFTTEEAVRFIAARLGRGDLPAGEADAARALAAELGLLPLALEQAASHLVAHHRPVREYLASLATAPLEVLEQSGPRTGGYARTVATTWRINIADAAAASSESAALLRWLAIMAPAPVPLSLLTAAGANPGDPSDALGAALARGAADRAALDSLIYPLLRHSLIERDPVEGVLRLNRVVQMAVRHELPLPAQQAAVRRLERRTV